MNVKQDKCLVTFWGTRGSIPTPSRTTEKYGGNTPCVSIQHEEDLLILDAGTGIRNLGLELAEEMLNKGELAPVHIFLSHLHWDHIQGLPFFAPVFFRDAEINIYLRDGKKKALTDVIGADYFPVEIPSLPAHFNFLEMKEGTLRIGDANIEWQDQIFHPGGSVRYKIEIGGKRVIYATDVEINKMFETQNENDDLIRQRKDYLAFIREADLLIADGQYSDSEYSAKQGWGHGSVPHLLETAYSVGVKKLMIFHHDPEHTDQIIDELYMEYGAKYYTASPAMEVHWAREGITISV